MNVLRQATQFLNPEQTTIIALGAPLLLLAKFTQWKWQEIHDENKFVILLRGGGGEGSHIEMVEIGVWSTYGDYLEESGWTSILTQAGIASSGTADSYSEGCSQKHDMLTRSVLQLWQNYTTIPF